MKEEIKKILDETMIFHNLRRKVVSQDLLSSAWMTYFSGIARAPDLIRTFSVVRPGGIEEYSRMTRRTVDAALIQDN